MAQVTHHLLWGIKQLPQVGDEPKTPAHTRTHTQSKKKMHITKVDIPLSHPKESTGITGTKTTF